MNRFLAILALALLAVFGAPPRAVAKALSAQNIASGVFAVNNDTHAPFNSPQPPDFEPETDACGYETASGRSKWLSSDPIGEEGGLNLYGFLLNDSVNRIDIFGRLSYAAAQAERCRKKCEDEYNKCKKSAEEKRDRDLQAEKERYQKELEALSEELKEFGDKVKEISGSSGLAEVLKNYGGALNMGAGINNDVERARIEDEYYRALLACGAKFEICMIPCRCLSAFAAMDKANEAWERLFPNW